MTDDSLSFFPRLVMKSTIDVADLKKLISLSIFRSLYKVKSRFNEWPPSPHFDSINRDFTLNRDFLT